MRPTLVNSVLYPEATPAKKSLWGHHKPCLTSQCSINGNMVPKFVAGLIEIIEVGHLLSALNSKLAIINNISKLLNSKMSKTKLRRFQEYMTNLIHLIDLFFSKTVSRDTSQISFYSDFRALCHLDTTGGSPSRNDCWHLRFVKQETAICSF